MARARRTWAEGILEIRRLLREPTDAGQPSFWDDVDLLDLFNQERDLLEIILNETHEGWNIETYYTDLVAGQVKYQLPASINGVKRILVLKDDGREEPLERKENYGTEIFGNATVTGNARYPREYVVKGQYVYVYPTPDSNLTGALKIEVEEATDRVTSGSDHLIPEDWPLFTETLLLLATAVAAFDVEGSQGPEPGTVLSSLAQRRDRYLVALNEYIETRTRGLVIREPYPVGE